MVIDAARQTFDMQEIANRRFMYNTDTCALILGDQPALRGDSFGSHAEDHDNSGLYEPFDSFIRGWIGTGEPYTQGVIHFAPPVVEKNVDAFVEGYNTLQMFRENGAGAGTVVRGFPGAWEQPLSNILPGFREPEELAAVYPHTADHAREHGELSIYRQSNRLNRDCAKAIDAAISAHWNGTDLNPECVKGVIEQYGSQRVTMLLANAVNEMDYDRRFSPENRTWAKGFPALEGSGVIPASHPAKLDCFVSQARRGSIGRDAGQRPSAMGKLEAAKRDVKPPAPKAPGKKKDMEVE